MKTEDSGKSKDLRARGVVIVVIRPRNVLTLAPPNDGVPQIPRKRWIKF